MAFVFALALFDFTGLGENGHFEKVLISLFIAQIVSARYNFKNLPEGLSDFLGVPRNSERRELREKGQREIRSRIITQISFT